MIMFRPEIMDSDEFDEFDEINEVPLHQRIGKTGAAANAHKDLGKNAGTKRNNAATNAKSAKTANFLSGINFFLQMFMNLSKGCLLNSTYVKS